MDLNDVFSSGKPRKYKFPVGRGHSSGIGKTCGRGRKGQKARTGTSFRHYFEGGQMPMLRRLPKFGFNNAVFKTDFEVVNIGQLEKAFDAGAVVDEAALRAKGLVRRGCDGIKILGDGALTKKLVVKAHGFTKSAGEKIAKAGGTIETIALPGGKGKAPEGKPSSAKAAEGKPAAAKPAQKAQTKPPPPPSDKK